MRILLVEDDRKAAWVLKKGLGEKQCKTCHAQAWGPADRQQHAGLLAAEQSLKANPDDPKAALAVGPNNFCVYCHRRDTKWQGED